MINHIEDSEIKFKLGDILFTWDDEKEKINIRKHGIDFASAAGVFADTDAIVELNSFDEYTSEERFDIIGLVLGHLMFVVYVERLSNSPEAVNDIIRIISARKATRMEEIRYANGPK